MGFITIFHHHLGKYVVFLFSKHLKPNPRGGVLFQVRFVWNLPPEVVNMTWVFGAGSTKKMMELHPGKLTARWLEHGGPGLSRCISYLLPGSLT